MATRRRTTVPTRIATVSTWQRATHVQQTVRRRRLPFTGDARDLIRRAAALVAPLRPWRLILSFFPRRQRLYLDCEVDAHGIQTAVSVTLHASDVWLFGISRVIDRWWAP